MEAIERHKTILTFMRYPRTNNVADDTPVASCQYECKDGHCDFSHCFAYLFLLGFDSSNVGRGFALIDRCIENNLELQKFGTPRVFNSLLRDLAEYPQDHMTGVLDGFHIHRCNVFLLRVQRIENQTVCTNTRTGVLEYNAVRDEAFKATWHEKEKLTQALAKFHI
jgi:hypothetical protein